MQISPRPCFAMKLMARGVTFSAAIVRSPFVLAILVVDDDDHLAARMASIASSIGANGDFCRGVCCHACVIC